MLGDFIVWWALSSLILITMNSGRGHCAWWQFCKVPNQTHREIENEKMYAIKQIKICAEYRDMLPRPRLDLSGTPGLRPIGLSPGSWQTSLGLGSMSRYSAQILICIFQHGYLRYPAKEIQMQRTLQWLYAGKWAPKSSKYVCNSLSRCKLLKIQCGLNPVVLSQVPCQSVYGHHGHGRLRICPSKC